MRSMKARRGSTLVLVGVMLVAFVGVGAIASDIGRFYVVTGELQTAADAAALAGAVQLMKTAGANPEPVIDPYVVGWVAATNRADAGTPLSVSDSAVQMAFWTPGTNGAQGTLSYALNGKRPNAVTVTIARAPKGMFSQFLGQMAGVTMTRTGTAWIASLGSNCVRPWAFPYLALYKKVSGNANATSPAPDLDATQFSNFMDPTKPNTTRMFTVVGQNQTDASTPPNSGEWSGFNFTGNAGKPSFEKGIQGCGAGDEWYANKINPDAGQGKTLPGQADQYVTWSSSAITWSSGGGGKKGSPLGICAFTNATYAADCYAPPSSSFPGITINTAWGEPLGGGGAWNINFNYVGEFQLLCYYSDPTDKCSNNEPGTPNTGYPEGTVVGYIKTLKSRYITPDDILGNFTSNVQRVVLVK